MLLLNPIVKLATFEACLDVICNSGHTPHIQVDTTHPDYQGLETADPSGIIVLSISGIACMGFVADIDSLRFSVTAGQERNQILVPLDALVAIYAKEDQTMAQPFPFKRMVDPESEPVKIEPTTDMVATRQAKPKRKGFAPRLIQGGKE